MLVFFSRIFISLGDMEGYLLRRSAMAPLTMGVDMEVPLLVEWRYPFPLFGGQQLMIWEPGATTSGFLIQEKVGPAPECEIFS